MLHHIRLVSKHEAHVTHAHQCAVFFHTHAMRHCKALWSLLPPSPGVQADSLVYQTEKQLKELGDKIPAEVKSKVEASVATLKEAASKDDLAGMKSAIESLRTDTMAMGEAMYKVVHCLALCMHNCMPVGLQAHVRSWYIKLPMSHYNFCMEQQSSTARVSWACHHQERWAAYLWAC